MICAKYSCQVRFSLVESVIITNLLKIHGCSPLLLNHKSDSDYVTLQESLCCSSLLSHWLPNMKTNHHQNNCYLLLAFVICLYTGCVFLPNYSYHLDCKSQKAPPAPRPTSANFLRAHSRTGYIPQSARPASAEPPEEKLTVPRAQTAREVRQ